MKGTVIWFGKEKGYGFLRTEDGRDVFCHYSCIQMKGYKKLEAEQHVEFDIVDGPKGRPQADNVTVVEA